MAEVKKIHLDTLKISSISTEGPNKTATGGMAADTLLKYGKKFTIEMQDAMGRYDTLTELYGANGNADGTILAITDRFPGEKTLVGTTFVIDQATGAKQPLKICIPIFNCDGIFNLTQDAEGDVTTFDLNGQIARYESDAVGTVVADGKYTKGSDNCFYFFATNEAMTKVQASGYRTAFGELAGDEPIVAAETAILPAMLAKFGVVTVMDVDIYPAMRITDANADEVYSVGEWDAEGTFTGTAHKKAGIGE